MFKIIILSMFFISFNASSNEIKKTTYQEFDDMFKILQKTETELREAHQTHAGYALVNNNQITPANRSRWTSFSSTWNQNLNANKEMDEMRVKYKREGIFDCPGLFNIQGPADKVRCGLDYYKTHLFTLWSIMNKQLSGQLPAYKKDVQYIENELKEVKKKIQIDLKELKNKR